METTLPIGQSVPKRVEGGFGFTTHVFRERSANARACLRTGSLIIWSLRIRSRISAFDSGLANHTFNSFTAYCSIRMSGVSGRVAQSFTV